MSCGGSGNAGQYNCKVGFLTKNSALFQLMCVFPNDMVIEHVYRLI